MERFRDATINHKWSGDLNHPPPPLVNAVQEMVTVGLELVISSCLIILKAFRIELMVLTLWLNAF
jgi:hypothetical protein